MTREPTKKNDNLSDMEEETVDMDTPYSTTYGTHVDHK